MFFSLILFIGLVLLGAAAACISITKPNMTLTAGGRSRGELGWNFMYPV